jgi:hypothetical protein
MAGIDTRCCGSGTCIINEQGECWCGQKWDGNKMIPKVSSLELNAKQEGVQSTDTTPVNDQSTRN